MKNKIQLITYPDSLGGNLKTLKNVLDTYFEGLVEGGVHILPPFPSSGDRGFAPLTYLEINPAFGTWEDIAAIGERYDVALDLMVNHISAQSSYFKDFLRHGRQSEWADLFITLDKLWPTDGKPRQADLEKVFLRRQVPYSPYTQEGTGADLTVWTTFGQGECSQQIDLDVYSDKTRNLLKAFFDHFARSKVALIRLDAVGFVIKKMGTSCFFVRPDIDAFLSWMREEADERGIALLPEVHGDRQIATTLTEQGFHTYDFILPYRVLDCLIRKDSTDLYSYLKQRPQTLFTMLDCHDGLPVKPDLNGLYQSDEVQQVVAVCEKRGALMSRILSEEHKDEDGFDVHQICGTFYDLLGRDDHAYIAARAIQFFVPGIPQVYYVGLLAGENDLQRVRETGDRREINRHNFKVSEIEKALQKPVFKRLKWLMQLRNTHPAFNGEFKAAFISSQHICMEWRQGLAFCALAIDLAYGNQAVVRYTDEQNQLLERLI